MCAVVVVVVVVVRSILSLAHALRMGVSSAYDGSHDSGQHHDE